MLSPPLALSIVVPRLYGKREGPAVSTTSGSLHIPFTVNTTHTLTFPDFFDAMDAMELLAKLGGV